MQTPALDRLLLEIIETECVYSALRGRQFSHSGLISKAFVFTYIKQSLLESIKEFLPNIDTFIYRTYLNEENTQRLKRFFLYQEESFVHEFFSSLEEQTRISLSEKFCTALVTMKNSIHADFRKLNENINNIENSIQAIQFQLRSGDLG